MSAFILTTIQTQMNYYGHLTMMVLGITGNLLILILFNRQRHNACSIYLVSSAVTNLLYLPSTAFLKLFPVAYNDGSLGTLIFCKFSFGLPGFLAQVAKTILIWACIDRYMMTSRRASFRAFSTPKRAKYLVFFTYIFWLVAACHPFIFLTISNSLCTQGGVYAVFYTFYTILFIGLVPSVILIVFACLTHRNMKQLRTRVQPINQGAGQTNHIIQRRDRDLLVLVIAEVIVYIITTAPFPVVLLEIFISAYVLPVKNLSYFLTEIFALNVSFFLLYIFSAVPFYIYMVSSASFRRDFQQLMTVGCRKLRRPAPELAASRTQQTIVQQETRV